ncbi:MAG: efflux RND transporter permease subunit, partial [Vicinamibacteria bacterium]|nr:efflux RND transporter permease subunit [Vicinamibacteria bacterium]
FDIDRDVDLAAIDVQNRVNQAVGRLPADVRTNGVSVIRNTTGFMGGLGFFSRDERYSSLFISNYIDQYVRDAIKRVAGVGDVIIFGERKFAMRLWLDPAKLAGRRITPGDVLGALREQNVQVAAGALGEAPSSAEQMFTISVRAMGRLTEASEFENVVLKTGPGGALVRVKDVGRVELGAETYASNLRFQGLEAQGIGITLLPSANALDVFQGVMAEMARLEKSFPPGLEWAVAFDNVVVVRESIIEVVKTLGAAIVLVILVMFLFLQNWRSTVIPAITIPVSLIGTFAFIKLFGFSINTLTLFGIVLATGIVVDDAIVVIENIERHMSEYHKSARQASIDAMREVFGAVIVIGLVLVAVFVPVALFPGVTGRLYQQFSLTIAFAVVLSVFNAVTLTPALSALLLDKESHTHGRFFNAFNRMVDKGTVAYGALVRRLVGMRAAMIILFLGSLLATWGVYRLVPSAFVPEEDEGYFMVLVQAPPGASLEYSTGIARQAEAIILSDPDVFGTFAVMGFSFSGAAPNNGMIFAPLKPYGDRPGSEHSLAAVLGRLRGRLFGIPGAIVVAFPPPSIQGLGTFAGFQFELLDQTGATNLEGLAAAMNGLMGEARQGGRVQGLFSAFSAADPQLLVDIDRDKARSLGLPLQEVTDALGVFLGSQYVNDFDFSNRAYRVYVQADQQFRSSPADLKQLYARATNGDMISLDTVVTLSETTAPSVISHFNLFRSAEITGTPGPGMSSGEAILAMEDLATRLPAGFTSAWAGQSLEEIKSGTQAASIFALSVILVYLVLAAQYESFVLPLIILLGVPLAVFGALSAQWVRGFTNDVFCQVGLVLLVGLAAKNSILIVEFAEQLRGRGLSIVEAAVEASRIRLRPILMTSIAFILGVLPLALASGAGAGGRKSIGTTVAGGMLASTVLSIIFIPVLYVVIRTLAPGRGRRSHDGGVAEATATGPGGAGAAGVALLLTLSLAAPASAQEGSEPPIRKVAFQQAIDQALEKNPTVGLAATNILRSQGLLQQIRSGSLPRVTASIVNTTLDQAIAFDANVVQPRNQTTFGLSISAPILAAAQWAANSQAKDRLEVARLVSADARRQVAVSTAAAYLSVITQKRLVEIAARALDTAGAQFDYNRKRREGGIGSRLNELRAGQVVSTDETFLESSKLSLRRAQVALGVLLGEDGPIDTDGEPTFDVAPANLLDDLSARSDLRLLTAEQRASQNVLKGSSKDWWPTVSLTFDPHYLTPKGLFQPSKSWRLSLQLSQTIYNGGERKGVQFERQANAQATDFSLAQAQIQARAEVRNARTGVLAFERVLASARLAAEQANEVLKITITAFDAGASTNIEVIQAQGAARDVETAMAQAEDSLRQARFELLVALGRFPN